MLVWLGLFAKLKAKLHEKSKMNSKSYRPIPDFCFTFYGDQWMEKAFCFCQPRKRCALKPFFVNKLALFQVTTCLTVCLRAAWSLNLWSKRSPLLLLPASFHLTPNLPRPCAGLLSVSSFYRLMLSASEVLKLFLVQSCENVFVLYSAASTHTCPPRHWWIYWRKVWQSLTGRKCRAWLKQSIRPQAHSVCMRLRGSRLTLNCRCLEQTLSCL